MDKDRIDTLLERARAWPEEAQSELAEIASEIEAELAKGEYHASPAELRGIDRGLADLAKGRLATDEEVEAVLSKYRT